MIILELLKNELDLILILKQTKQTSLNLFNRITNALKVVRFNHTNNQGSITEDIISISREIVENIYEIIIELLKRKEDIQISLQSNLIQESIELIKYSQSEQITKIIVQIIFKIIENVSIKQIHKIYQLGIAQTLIPILKFNNIEIQQDILRILIIIFNIGWKQFKSYQSLIKSSLSSSSTEISLSQLQQLIALNIPHPYLADLEQYGIIQAIIDDMLLDEKVDKNNKKLLYDLLDIIYLKGIKLPSDQQEYIIKSLFQCAQSANEDSQINSLTAISILALNQENHNAIISEGGLNIASGNIKTMIQNQFSVDSQTVKYSILILLNLFLYGSAQTQQLIQNQIDLNSLNQLNYNECYESENNQLKSALDDPDAMKTLFVIRRAVERNSEDRLIELIQDGLMKMINEIYEKMFQCQEKLGKMNIIEQIIKYLIYNNSKVSQTIIEQTDFIDHQVQFINSIPLDKIEYMHLSLLKSITINLPIEYKQQLFLKEVVQSMIKILYSDYQSVREKASTIFTSIIEAGIQGLQQGEQHPYYQQLLQDKSVDKLIQLLQDMEREDIHKYIACNLAYLFKAVLLPQLIQINLINLLKDRDDHGIDKLTLLAECPGNHNAILADGFERKLFENEQYSLQYLNITLLFLRYGSYGNKKKLSSVKEKVEKLTDDKIMDEMREKYNWDQKKIDEIKDKTQDVLELIGCNF